MVRHMRKERTRNNFRVWRSDLCQIESFRLRKTAELPEVMRGFFDCPELN